MQNDTTENYIKALYYLDLKNTDISITDLGKELQVSKPSANAMVKRLASMGVLKYQKYKPLKLTQKGREQAISMIRKHRLCEMFLNRIMGFGWEEVHEIAEEMEHISQEHFFDRMDELLGFPSEDPHGSPIPDKNGQVIKKNYRLLSEIGVGESVTLRALRNSSADFIAYLNKKNLSLGLCVKVEGVEAFDKSLHVSFSKKETLTLSHQVCNRLLVE